MSPADGRAIGVPTRLGALPAMLPRLPTLPPAGPLSALDALAAAARQMSSAQESRGRPAAAATREPLPAEEPGPRPAAPEPRKRAPKRARPSRPTAKVPKAKAMRDAPRTALGEASEAALKLRLKWPFGTTYSKTPHPVIAAASSPRRIRSAVKACFGIQDDDQIRSIVVNGVRFLELWPAAEPVCRAAIDEAASVAPRAGARQVRCHICLRFVTNTRRHLEQHLGVAFACTVPGCGRIFYGARSNLRTHATRKHGFE